MEKSLLKLMDLKWNKFIYGVVIKIVRRLKLKVINVFYCIFFFFYDFLLFFVIMFIWDK